MNSWVKVERWPIFSIVLAIGVVTAVKIIRPNGLRVQTNIAMAGVPGVHCSECPAALVSSYSRHDYLQKLRMVPSAHNETDHLTVTKYVIDFSKYDQCLSYCRGLL